MTDLGGLPSFLDDDLDFEVAELSITPEVERQAKAAVDEAIEEGVLPSEEGGAEEPTDEGAPGDEPVVEETAAAEPVAAEPDAADSRTQAGADLGETPKPKAGSEKAVAILAQLAAQMRQEKAMGEPQAQELDGPSSPGGGVSERDAGPGAGRTPQGTVRPVGLLDAAVFGDRLKNPAVRAVYAAGRRAGLVEAARALHEVLEREEVTLADLHDFEEKLYAVANAKDKSPKA